MERLIDAPLQQAFDLLVIMVFNLEQAPSFTRYYQNRVKNTVGNKRSSLFGHFIIDEEKNHFISSTPVPSPRRTTEFLSTKSESFCRRCRCSLASLTTFDQRRRFVTPRRLLSQTSRLKNEFWMLQNKLECLSLASFSSLVQWLLVRPEPTPFR